MANVPLEQKLATKVETRDGVTTVLFHGTEVVCFNAELIRLNSGGWQTVTTKRRICQARDRFDLRFWFYQKRGEWWIEFSGEEPIRFYDGIKLSRDRSQPHPDERNIPGDQEYNGWRNRATWNVMLWLNGTEKHYRRYSEAAQREPFTMMSARDFAIRAFGYRSIFTARTPDGEPLNRAHWPSIADAMNEARQ